ncbi:Alkaline phosphatase [Smittium culicis]|uniref:alkaline phosphatase n=1 Tax=Smittium culicis TaxID=133412 RepID=A0A1R1Y8D0_9FUNG|nr:Alkaline phosphatase [Smittium culicis]
MPNNKTLSDSSDSEQIFHEDSVSDSEQILRSDFISGSSSSLLNIQENSIPDSPLIHPQYNNFSSKKSSSFMKKTFFFALGSTFVLSIFLISKFLTEKKVQVKSDGPVNVILMISDGFGPASETMARQFYQSTNRLPASWKSPLDDILVGSSRTQSSDSLITDSAAGATAFSCAMKSYNGAIAGKL